MSNCCNSHLDHADDLPRLNRIGGQVKGIKELFKRFED